MPEVKGSDQHFEVPPEYAEVYERAFRKAYDQTQNEESVRPAAGGLHVALVGAPRGSHTGPAKHRSGGLSGLGGSLSGLGGFGLTAVVVVLLVAAFLTGRALLGPSTPSGVVAPTPTSSPVPPTPTPTPTATSPTSSPTSPSSPVRLVAVPVQGATASCVAPTAYDTYGKPVRYAPALMLDDSLDSAWRCDGAAVGTRIVLTLPRATSVAGVGLVGGYAKTDPRNGADRYAENNRLTTVRWTFGPGASTVQHLDGSPRHRALQTLRVRPVTTRTVTLTILAVAHGSQDTTAISTLRLFTTQQG